MKRHDSIDWEAVRSRLDRNRAAMESAVSPGADRLRLAFRDRAARLACRPEQESGDRTAVLAFRLGAGRYGIELGHVVEVLAHPRCAPVPGAPPEIAGVVPVRGEIRPVWDLRRLLELPDLEDRAPGYVILLRIGRSDRGLTVTSVDGVEMLRPGPPGGSARVKWISPDLVTVLDPEGLWKEES